MNNEWVSFGSGEQLVYGSKEGPVAFVCACPFGWIVSWKDRVDGLYVSREAAMKAAEEGVES